MYPANGRVFLPEPQHVLIPLDMDPAEADELFGAEFMAAIREAAKRMQYSDIHNQYVQIVPVPKERPQ